MYRVKAFALSVVLLMLSSVFLVAWSAEGTNSDAAGATTQEEVKGTGKDSNMEATGSSAADARPQEETRGVGRIPGVASETPNAGNESRNRKGELFISSKQMWITLGIILFMAYLFVHLLKWQQRGEQAGYFANIYKDTLETLEFSRVSSPIDEEWNQGNYLSELIHASSKRARNWLSKNERPKPSDDQLEEARKVGFEAELLDMQSIWQERVLDQSRYLPRVGGQSAMVPHAQRRSADATRLPGLRDAGGYGGLGGYTSIDDETMEPVADAKSDRAKREQIRNIRSVLSLEFGALLDEWASRAGCRSVDVVSKRPQ
jgi:hypothetical protein